MSSFNTHLDPLGAAAAADSNRQIVPEKADGDPGARAAGVEPCHTGEKTFAFMLGTCYVAAISLNPTRLPTAQNAVCLPSASQELLFPDFCCFSREVCL